MNALSRKNVNNLSSVLGWIGGQSLDLVCYNNISAVHHLLLGRVFSSAMAQTAFSI